MSTRERAVESLPDEFTSYEEAAEFWGTHDTTGYPGAFEDEPVEIRASFRKRHFEIEVEEDLLVLLREKARRSGVTVRQLTSDLLRRQLVTST